MQFALLLSFSGRFHWVVNISRDKQKKKEECFIFCSPETICFEYTRLGVGPCPSRRRCFETLGHAGVIKCWLSQSPKKKTYSQQTSSSSNGNSSRNLISSKVPTHRQSPRRCSIIGVFGELFFKTIFIHFTLPSCIRLFSFSLFFLVWHFELFYPDAVRVTALRTVEN